MSEFLKEALYKLMSITHENKRIKKHSGNILIILTNSETMLCSRENLYSLRTRFGISGPERQPLEGWVNGPH